MTGYLSFPKPPPPLFFFFFAKNKNGGRGDLIDQSKWKERIPFIYREWLDLGSRSSIESREGAGKKWLAISMKITDIGSGCFDCHCLLSHWSVFIDHIAIFYLFPLKPPVAKGMARCRVERTKRLMARFTKIDKNDLSSWRRKNKKMTPDFTCLCSTRSFDNDATKNLPRHHDIITAVSTPSFLYWKIIFF